ncbi:MAG: FIST signal transduction protein [Thermomicrobiales bacterium]
MTMQDWTFSTAGDADQHHVDTQTPPPPETVDAVTPHAAAAAVSQPSWRVALERAISQTLSPEHGPPDLVMLFASTAYAADYPELLRETRERTCAATIVGCSGSGVLGAGIELEDVPALALIALWLPGAILRPVRVHQEMIGFVEPTLWPHLMDVEPAIVSSWIMLADPFRLDVQTLLDGLGAHYPGLPIVGGLTSSHRDERRGWIFLNDHVYDEGAVALAIGGPYHVLPVVSHGCEPIGETWTVTGVDRNVLHSISNRPALDVMEETLQSVPATRRQHARDNLVVGFAADEYRDEFHRGDYLVRGVIGIDEAGGSMTIGGMPRLGQTIQFQVRDADVADIDLVQALTEARAILGTRKPVAGMLFACTARGETLFGLPNHDAAAVQAAFSELPVIGVSVCAEIAPAGRRIGLQGFTATLGLLVHDPTGSEM